MMQGLIEAQSGITATMNYLHTMVRVNNLDESLNFYCQKLGLVELKRYDGEAGRFTLVVQQGSAGGADP